MATNTNTAPSLDKIASLLGIGSNELDSLLYEEFKVISADPIESIRHPSDPKEFIQYALEQIDQLAADPKYLPVLKKIIHRDEPRKFYFYPNELEAISRILLAIENNVYYQIDLDELDLYTLPTLLGRLPRLQRLKICNNKLLDISIVADLPDLQELIANDNQVNDINFLGSNTKLRVLCLNRNNIKSTYEVLKTLPALRELELAGNRINDILVRPILENPYLEKVVLSDNPINAPLNILNDIEGLRAYFDIVFMANAGRGETISKNSITQNGPMQRKTKRNTKSIASEPNAPNEVQAQSAAENNPGERNTGINTPEPAQEQTVAAESSTAEPGTASKDDHPASETEQASEAKQYISNPIRNILLRGNPRDNLLDIEKLSSIFYNLIANSDNNGEHFFGLFGRWGRGKTFFWKYILDHRLDPKKYIPIEFHAWKYQDTPGIWAYLYNTLNEAYLGDKPKWYQLVKWIKYYKKILILNGQRGKLPILVGFLVSLGVAVGVYYYNYYFKGDKTVQTVLRIGIPISAISMLVYITKTFKTDARKIILSLTSSVNFNSQLGFQHEIQQELKYLLKAWIPDQKLKKKKDGEQEKAEEEKVAQKRIFLFIDDIDRCSEDKIIQIVDYIRVLLHCPAIQDRVTVLAAIDERILLHAIQDKYKDFIANKDNDATYKELCREYMDKLFLAGLKLGPLTVFEKRQIVEGFTRDDTAKEDETTQSATNGIKSSKVGEIISHTGKKESVIERQKPTPETGDVKVAIPEVGLPKSEQAGNDIPQAQTEETVIPVKPIQIASTARKEYPYEKWEQEFIKDILARNTESTPRSIRVYTYRYLLGKQLVEKALIEGKIAWSQWYNTKEAKQCFAIKLLHYGFKSDTEHLLSDYQKFISEYDENKSFNENVYGYNISLNQELGSIMFQVLTMIIAY
jgi:Leucine-rich repeat (LRR) protein